MEPVGGVSPQDGGETSQNASEPLDGSGDVSDIDNSAGASVIPENFDPSQGVTLEQPDVTLGEEDFVDVDGGDVGSGNVDEGVGGSGDIVDVLTDANTTPSILGSEIYQEVEATSDPSESGTVDDTTKYREDTAPTTPSNLENITDYNSPLHDSTINFEDEEMVSLIPNTTTLHDASNTNIAIQRSTPAFLEEMDTDVYNTTITGEIGDDDDMESVTMVTIQTSDIAGIDNTTNNAVGEFPENVTLSVMEQSTMVTDVAGVVNDATITSSDAPVNIDAGTFSDVTTIPYDDVTSNSTVIPDEDDVRWTTYTDQKDVATDAFTSSPVNSDVTIQNDAVNVTAVYDVEQTTVDVDFPPINANLTNSTDSLFLLGTTAINDVTVPDNDTITSSYDVTFDVTQPVVVEVTSQAIATDVMNVTSISTSTEDNATSTDRMNQTVSPLYTEETNVWNTTVTPIVTDIMLTNVTDVSPSDANVTLSGDMVPTPDSIIITTDSISNTTDSIDYDSIVDDATTQVVTSAASIMTTDSPVITNTTLADLVPQTPEMDTNTTSGDVSTAGVVPPAETTPNVRYTTTPDTNTSAGLSAHTSFSSVINTTVDDVIPPVTPSSGTFNKTSSTIPTYGVGSTTTSTPGTMPDRDVMILSIGAIAGFLVLAVLIIVCCICIKKCKLRQKKKQYRQDAENVNEFQFEIKPRPGSVINGRPKSGNGQDTIGPRTLPRSTPLPPARYDNPMYDDPNSIINKPLPKNIFMDGYADDVKPPEVKGIPVDEEENEEPVVIMRTRPLDPKRDLKCKSRMSMGPIMLQDDMPSTQNTYDTIYTTHNTFKRPDNNQLQTAL